MDITDPDAPNLLWEFGHNLSGKATAAGDNELGFAMTYPAIVKVGAKWFAVFGSGTKASYVPDYGGVSDQTANVFVVDLETGQTAAKFAVSDTASFFSDPVAVDIDFKSDKSTTPPGYETDAIYIGETYYLSTGGGSWNGRMWRIVTNGDTTPANWKMSLLYNTPGQSITSAPAISNDEDGNLWVYFGTGRYLNETDKTDVTPQGLYGMKDVCWDPSTETWIAPCLVTASSPSVTNLLDTTDIVVKTTGGITGYGGTGTADTFDELVAKMNSYDGWYMKLEVPRERSLNKPSIIGGLVLTTSFVPSADLCGFGGNSYLYSLYYKTGTAYKASTIGLKRSDNTVVLKRLEEPSVGLASSVAVHAGREEGAAAFVQMSTGETKRVAIAPAETIKSGIVSWREM
jgi:type IV pilus assembly protein PilY1